MKTIKNLTVKVTYTVSLSDIEVSDEVFESINAISEEGQLDEDNCDHYKGHEWLGDHIKEADAFEWEFEVYDVD